MGFDPHQIKGKVVKETTIKFVIDASQKQIGRLAARDEFQFVARNAFNIARAKVLPKMLVYIVDRLIEHENIQALTPGTDLSGALGLDPATDAIPNLREALQATLISPTSKAPSKGKSVPSKFTTGGKSGTRFPGFRVGMTEQGKSQLEASSFGTYVSTATAKGRIGTQTPIPWLSWILNPNEGPQVRAWRVFPGNGASGTVGRTSRTGTHIMKRGGSFSAKSWLPKKSSYNFIADVIEEEKGTLEFMFMEALGSAMDAAVKKWNQESKSKAGIVTDVRTPESAGSGEGLKASARGTEIENWARGLIGNGANISEAMVQKLVDWAKASQAGFDLSITKLIGYAS